MIIKELKDIEKSYSRADFVIYIADNEEDRIDFIATIKSHASKRNAAVEEISILTDDIDGTVIIKNNAGYNDIPAWWHTEAFVTIVRDLEKIAMDQDKYPKFSRLVYTAPGSTSLGGLSKRKLPSGSFVCAVITEADVTAVEHMFPRLGDATQASISAFRAGTVWKKVVTTSDESPAILEDVIIQFCNDFIENPYRCYTEHGQHALFYSMLYNALPAEKRDLTFIDTTNSKEYKVCAIQKEYPTCFDLGKSQRQNWDISIIKPPATANAEIATEKGKELFDYLNLFAVIEFGMNEHREHLVDDFLRVSHPAANTEHPYIVHLYRLSDPGKQVSGRDKSANSFEVQQLIEKTDGLKEFLKKISNGIAKGGSLFDDPWIKEELQKREQAQNECKPVTIFFGYVDVSQSKPKKFLYRISGGEAKLINTGDKP